MIVASVASFTNIVRCCGHRSLRWRQSHCFSTTVIRLDDCYLFDKLK